MGIGVFDKDNIRKSRGDNLGNTGADTDGGTKADNPGIKTDADKGVDNLSRAADDPSKAADNPGIAIDDPGIAGNDPGKVTDNPGTESDADVRADNLSTAAKNKTRAASLFILRCTLFLLISSSELMTVSLPSFLPFSFSTTLRLKPMLLCSVTLVKQRALSFRYPMDKMWTSSLN